MRRRIDTVFRLDGGKRIPARSPVSGPGGSFIGRGTAFRYSSKRLRGTIIVIWGEKRSETWIILTDLPSTESERAAGAQAYRERISSRLVDAEPSSDQGRDVALRPAAARTVAVSAGGREGRLSR